jgi:4-hydroxybenzoate polyprenyltransferase
MTIAIVAGASLPLALRLGLGMLGIQFAIGAVNDIADAVPDAIGKMAKPIPAGRVRRREALGLALASAAVGCAAAASVGPAVLMLALAGLADGLLYDLRLKRGPLAWAPFAAGVGLLPVYAWWGARGSLPVAVLAVAGVAVVAGTALALANAYADIECDTRAGIGSVATVLGRTRTLRIDALLMAAVQASVVATTVIVGASTPFLFTLAFGCALGWGGLGLARVEGERWRPLVWEIQALGFFVAGGAWLAALVSAGALRG